MTLSLIVVNCNDSEEKTSEIQLNLSGPMDQVLIDNYLLVINSNYNHIYKTGSLLVIDTNTDKKVAAVEIPSLSSKMLLLKNKRKLLISCFLNRNVMQFDVSNPLSPKFELNYEFDFEGAETTSAPYMLESDENEQRVFVTTRTRPIAGIIHYDNSYLYQITPGVPQTKLLAKLELHTEVMHYIPERNALLFLPTYPGMLDPNESKVKQIKESNAHIYKYFIYELDNLDQTDYQPYSAYIKGFNRDDTVWGNFIVKYVIEKDEASTPDTTSENSNNNDWSAQQLARNEEAFITTIRGNGTVFVVSNYQTSNDLKFEIIRLFEFDKDVNNDFPVEFYYFQENGTEKLLTVNWKYNKEYANNVQSSLAIEHVPVTTDKNKLPQYNLPNGAGSLDFTKSNDKFYILNMYINSISVVSYVDGKFSELRTID